MSGNPMRATCGLVMVFCILSAEAISAGIDTDRRVRFNQGVDAFTRGATGQAIQIFEGLLQDEPEDAAVLYYLGLTYLEREQYAEATGAFEKVLRIQPELVEAALDAAIAQLGQNVGATNQAARSSLAKFLQARAEGPDAALGSFFLGVAEYRLENYEAALSALDQAEKLDTEERLRKDILFYRGLALARGGRPDEASAEFKKLQTYLQEKPGDVLEMRPETKERLMSQTRNLLRQVEERKPITLTKDYDFRVKLDLGFSYDTNAVLLGDETRLPVNVAQEEDFRFGLGSDIRYLQRVTDKFSFGIGGGTYNNWHPNVDEFNLQTYAGRAFLNYALTDDLLIGIQYDYDYNLGNFDVRNASGTFLDKKWSGFLSRNRVTPSMRYTELYHDDDVALTWTTLFYQYDNRDYLEKLRFLELNRDGNYHLAGVLQDWNITKLGWQDEDDENYLHAQIGYSFRNASTVGDEFDLTGHTLSTGVDVPLPWKMLFEFTGQWTWENYWQPSLFDAKRRPREDFIQRYTWAVGRAFELSRHVELNVRGEIALTLDDSNIVDRGGQEVYSYDRTIYGMVFSFIFR